MNRTISLSLATLLHARAETNWESTTNFQWLQVGNDIDGPNDAVKFGQGVAVNEDGSRVVVGGYPQQDSQGIGKVNIYEEKNGQFQKIGQTLKTHWSDTNDGFGKSVGMSYDGSRVVVGAPYHEAGNRRRDSSCSSCYYYYYYDAGGDYGRVRIYELQDDSWNKIGTTDGSEYDNNGFSVAMSADGSRVVMGSPGSLGALGTIRVLEEDTDGDWVQLGSDIQGDATTSWDRFGWAVSISHDGHKVAGGAIGNDDGNSPNSGQARVFEYVDGGWAQVGGDINGVQSNENNGEALSLSYDGSRVAVGSPNFGTNYDGRARIFELIDGSWTQIGSDIYADLHGYTASSVSLSAAGATVAVGSTHNNNDVVSRAGDVQVFHEVDGEWVQIGSAVAGEDNYNYFGEPVVLSSDGLRFAGGAPYNDGGGFWRGHARVYKLENLCTDSRFKLISGDGVLKSCSGVGQDQCSDTAVASHCPATCAACPNYSCVDSEATFRLRGNLRSCSNVPPQFVQAICRFAHIKNTCRGTCGLCP